MHERSRPTLDEILSDPRRVEEFPQDEVSALMARLCGLLAVLAVHRTRSELPDRLLDAKEAGEMLGVPAQYLYTHDFPFSLKVGRHTRFSFAGIQKWIRTKVGRKT